MTDQIPLPPPDYTEDVQGFVHDTERRYYSEQTMRAYAERLHAARVKTLPTQLMAGLQAEVDALRHQLQTLAELGDASGDAQILRMGYAAARLEIESLNTQLQTAREEIERRDAQLDAIGAGGVEPLRPRQCLHQISEPVRWPKDAKEVRTFFSSNFIRAEFVADNQEPCDEDRYYISAHDFLSAVNWWADFPHVQPSPSSADEGGSNG